MDKFRIISVDPAPSKKSTVYDSYFLEHGENPFLELDAIQLYRHFKKAKDESKKILALWDAPLTGPWLTDLKQESDSELSDCPPFYFRKIEKHFSEKYRNIVSVLGYAGCSHWAISQAILGLPRIGDYCCPPEKLPFRLLTEKSPPRDESGHFVVETHPALGVAILLGKKADDLLNTYKKRGKAVGERNNSILKLVKMIDKHCHNLGYPELTIPSIVKTDDQLDAFVGFIFAKIWLAGGPVEIHGNLLYGAMLLPREK